MNTFKETLLTELEEVTTMMLCVKMCLYIGSACTFLQHHFTYASSESL